ncbi:hypothetical protein RUND412_009962, partial [Rhizina undulata]
PKCGHGPYNTAIYAACIMCEWRPEGNKKLAHECKNAHGENGSNDHCEGCEHGYKKITSRDHV